MTNEEENKNNPQGTDEANKSQQAGMAEGEGKVAGSNLKDDVGKIDAELYEKRKTELTELEKKVDKKTKELNDAVDGYKAEGMALAGAKKDAKPEETNAEYTKKVMAGETPGEK